MSKTNQDLFLTTAQAADRLGISYDALKSRRAYDRKLMQQGKPILGPKWIKLLGNGSVFYHRDEIDQYLSRQLDQHSHVVCG